MYNNSEKNKMTKEIHDNIRQAEDRKMLIDFFKFFRDNGEEKIGLTIEQFVDAFLSAKNIKND